MSYEEINSIFSTPPSQFCNGEEKDSDRFPLYFGVSITEISDDNWQVQGVERDVYYLRYTFRTTTSDSGYTLSFQFQSNELGNVTSDSWGEYADQAFNDGLKIYCAISKDKNAFIDLSNVINKQEVTVTKINNYYNFSCTDIYFPDYLEPNSLYYLWIFPEYTGNFSCAFDWKDNSYYAKNITKSYSITNPVIYTLSYHANGGAVASLPPSQSCNRGLKLTIPSTTPQREGYTFQGWSNSPLNLPIYQPGSSFTPVASQTLYAIWALNGLMLKRYKAYIRQENGSGKPYKIVVRTNNAGNYNYYKPTIGMSSLQMTIHSEGNACEPGNVFYDNDNYDLNLYLQKNDNAAQYIYYKINVTDLIQNTTEINYISSKTALPSSGSKKISLSERLNTQLTTTRYGIFKISVTAYNDQQIELTSIDYIFCRTRKALPCSMVGMNLHIPNNAIIAQNLLNLMKNTGTSVWRISIPWATVEKNKGLYEIPNLAKQAIQFAKNNNLRPLIILAYGNDLYNETNPNDTNWLTGYVNYCSYIIHTLYQEYGIKDFEIWNEWNANIGKVPILYRDGDQYAKVVCAVNDAIDSSTRSKITIVGGAVAGAVEEWIENFIAYNNGEVINKINIFSFHTYPLVKDNNNISVFDNPEKYNYLTELEKIKTKLPYKPIWLTETGWPTHTGTSLGYKGVTEEEQAAYLVQLYAQIMNAANTYNIQNICWYDMMNDGVDKINPQDNFGLLYSNVESNTALQYAPKPGYVALGTLGFILQEISNGKTVDILWNNTGNQQYTPNGNETILDMYGNEIFYWGSIQLTYKPIYVIHN